MNIVCTDSDNGSLVKNRLFMKFMIGGLAVLMAISLSASASEDTVQYQMDMAAINMGTNLKPIVSPSPEPGKEFVDMQCSAIKISGLGYILGFSAFGDLETLTLDGIADQSDAFIDCLKNSIFSFPKLKKTEKILMIIKMGPLMRGPDIQYDFITVQFNVVDVAALRSGTLSPEGFRNKVQIGTRSQSRCSYVFE